MTNEKVFSYAGFDLSIKDLYGLLKHTRLADRYNKHKWNHSDWIIESIINCIAEGNYTAKGVRTFRMLEKLVEGNGYDFDGHYSEESKAAMKNLYNDQIAKGIPTRRVELRDIPMSNPFTIISKKIGGFFKATTQKTKQVVKKSMVWAGIAVASVFGYTLFKNNTQVEKAPLPVKNKTEQKQTTQTTSTEAQTLGAEAFNQTSRQKIEANKNVYRQQAVVTAEQARQNKLDSLKKESYNIRLNMLLGDKQQGYVDKVQKKMDAGLFDANGLTATQLVYFAYQSKVYDGNTIIHKVLSSDKKVSAEDNAAFLGYISEMGEYAGKLKKRAQLRAENSGKSLSNYSSFDKASKNTQKQYVKNLQQLRELRNR